MHIVSCFAFHLYQILTSTENGSGKIIEAGKRGLCACVYEHVCTHVVSYASEEEEITTVSVSHSPCSKIVDYAPDIRKEVTIK